ncbi:MAG: chorismate-binding protein [Bacteroides sp.]|nr:chorismate-binding protein [Roseburia sp.]MCM1347482.1 chorismate-binding protein [Bacteroides sp.]MCM1421954.1 chorismate-binding protein [Bacteroides sp.]
MVEKIHKIIDGAYAFALYRLPFSDECHVVVQLSACPQAVRDMADLEDRCGFVMLPFHADGGHPVILISPEKEECIRLRTHGGTTSATTSADCEADGSKDEDYSFYCQVFRKFHESLCAGEFEKLVLSRRKTLYAGDIDLVEVFLRACAAYPRMMVYMCFAPECGTWIGSTPEILLAGCKSHYRTVALAGTMAINTPEDTALHTVRWSEKNMLEQRIVADYVRERLRPYACVIEEEGPYTSRAGQLLHLKTEFHFSSGWSRTDVEGSDSSGEPADEGKTAGNTCNMSGLIGSLHPTPAVCGLPQEKALRFILENEGYDRSYYSGVVGMLNSKGETDLYVNLRCASVAPDGTATLYAGGGLLPSSTVESEWAETEEKLKTILNVFR